MPFYRMDHRDGTTSVAHVNIKPVKMAPEACVFPDFTHPHEQCRRMAVALCDYPVGIVLAGGAVTCDRPMCARHRTPVGEHLDHCPNHAVTKEPSMKNASETETTPEQDVIKEEPNSEPSQAPTDQGDGHGESADPSKGDDDETGDA